MNYLHKNKVENMYRWRLGKKLNNHVAVNVLIEIKIKRKFVTIK